MRDRRFRANPAYALVTVDEFADRIGAPSPPLPADGPLYGYLRPQGSAQLPCRAISPDTALLFLTLQRGGQVPGYFRTRLGCRADDEILRLVLDDILEIEHEGIFISGGVAGKMLTVAGRYAVSRPLTRLSIEALRYGEALADLTAGEIAGRIYGFGRRPMTPDQKRKFHNGEIGGSASASGTGSLDRYWTLAATANPYWIMWRPTRNRSDGEPARFKLYVSPTVSHIAESFSATVESLGQSRGAVGLKLGRDRAGLTRPDKLVAYFSRLDDLQEAGLRLYRRLAGCPVHGVPFTAELVSDGLLSWGADRRRVTPAEPESWRFWIASRLATHLTSARESGAPAPLWPQVLDRIRLDGVDPEVWAPTDEFWSSLALP